MMPEGEIGADPYAVYRYYRSADPIHWDISPGGSGHAWYFFRYVDVRAGLKDRRLCRENPSGRDRSPDSDWAIFRDPPEHTRLRNLLRQAFEGLPAQALLKTAAEAADFLIESFPASGTIDFMSAFAERLPLLVMSNLYGLAGEEQDAFLEHSFSMLSPGLRRKRSPLEQRLAGDRARTRLRRLFTVLAAERRKWRSDDMVSRFLSADVNGEGWSDEEVVSNCFFLLVTGYDTVVNLLGNGLLALVTNREQMTLLREQPELLPGAVEESLRYDSPVQMVDRWVAEDFEMRGKVLRRGERVYLVIGAANRDAEIFGEPDQFDIARKNPAHLAFGMGIHSCLGATLTGLQAQGAFRSLLNRIGGLNLAGPPQWRRDPNFRALDSLNVTFMKEKTNAQS